MPATLLDMDNNAEERSLSGHDTSNPRPSSDVQSVAAAARLARAEVLAPESPYHPATTTPARGRRSGFVIAAKIAGACRD